MTLLAEKFYQRKTVTVAKELLGKVLCYKSHLGFIQGIICETEAYTQEDPSCHAYKGKKTTRNRVMFEKGGTLYIYFVYGLYHCLNIVTEEKNRGCAVLLRSVLPISGESIIKRNRPGCSQQNLTNGPAKLVKGFGVSPHLNGTLCNVDSPLTIEDLGHMPQHIKQTQRIGISKGKDLLWRFYCTEFACK